MRTTRRRIVAIALTALLSCTSGEGTTPSLNPPGAPTNVAGVPGDGQATVSWTPANDNGSPITRYVVTASPGGATATTPGGNKTSATVTGLTNGTSYAFTVVATNAAGDGPASLPSVAVVPTASPPPPMGPLRVSATNSHYFVDPAGKPVLLTGSHTWDSFQDLSRQQAWPYPNLVDFAAYVQLLKSHNHNLTILWRKDLPTYFGWGAGGTWYIRQWPWKRTGPGNASDGLPRFDLTLFDDSDTLAHDSYFERLRTRALQLQQNGIYAIVQLFDGLQLHDNRNGGTADGYPFGDDAAGSFNNVQGIGDDHAWGSMNASLQNTSANIMPYQDAYVRKVVDTLHDLQNVLYEISEEAPYDSGDPTKTGPDGRTWTEHMIHVVHTYEAAQGYALHPVGYGAYQGPVDQNLLTSTADWVAPAERVFSGGNAGKVIINDSDHTYFGTMWTDSPIQRRNYVWENFCNGVHVIFMDPYVIYWSSNNRNLCANPTQGVCSADVSNSAAYPEDVRVQMGYTSAWGGKLTLLAMTPQGSLSSTGYVLAHVSATSGEYLIYAPSGGSFTVNLSGSPATLNVEWFDPATGSTTAGSPVSGGTTQTFTPPGSITGDAVLHLK
jgi:Fibronectin type III domain/Putative collagen-binding domain of a collagenase